MWRYAYDEAGRLIRQVDAAGTATTLDYDAIDRVTTKAVRPSSGASETVVSAYDQPRSGFFNVGRLTAQWNEGGRLCRGYDRAGRATLERRGLPDAATCDAAGLWESRTSLSAWWSNVPPHIAIKHP